ncbi:hypothetical protein F5890DRAFT_1473887 [Lentinula detonsa]|uniref:Uncharacterized protein n=1 Tax=Lentinula detonsa TaxID=2804962 RepID=A0AA38Q0M3_9AGAR|nr:hypothetical protein F5890DRAFT_1473887 [Lentinula detonsa]
MYPIARQPVLPKNGQSVHGKGLDRNYSIFWCRSETSPSRRTRSIFDDFYASMFPALAILPAQSRQTMNLVLHIWFPSEATRPCPEDALGNEGDLDLDLDYNVDGAVRTIKDHRRPYLKLSLVIIWQVLYESMYFEVLSGFLMLARSVMEQNLTVPLPFRFCTTVWLFLIFLPFLLVATFGWHSITGALIASFIYLGFLAAGEEIEQPFGYDEDLDSSDISVSIFRG